MPNPEKVLITGGHEVGGVASFAEGLAQGFTVLGIPAEVIPPSHILSHWRDLRDAKVLKILSTTAVYAAPFARRAICMAHGIPRAHRRGGLRMLAILGTWKFANACSGTQLVSVSRYTAVHLQALFEVRTDAVILNPVKPIFLESPGEPEQERCYVTFAGRLDPCKNLHRLLPAIRDLLGENPALRVCIIGEGSQKAALMDAVKGDPRFEFKGYVDDETLCSWLRRSKLFVSGNETEGLGISYLEALSQGCVVAMPASGGGLEVALDQVGKSVHLLPLSFDRAEVLSVLRRALVSHCAPIPMTAHSAEAVAEAYLCIDARFSTDGTCALPKREFAVGGWV